jgi:serine/threonine-protein phosphatase 2A regulatory subunit A
MLCFFYQNYLHLLLVLLKDKVPNVRFNVAKTLGMLCPFLDGPTLQTRVKPCLQKLSDDNDKDVRYFGGETASKMKKR